jgi:amino acid transporter
MRKLRWNWPVWLGFVLSIVAFVSYFLVFARFPVTRNVPWANFLLFGAGAAFLWVGLRRVLGGAQPCRGKIVSSILTLLSVSIVGAFCFVIFHATRQLPTSPGSPKVGQKAPEFALRNTHGNLVSLSSLLSTPLDPLSPSQDAPKAVLLVFYRGYW